MEDGYTGVKTNDARRPDSLKIEDLGCPKVMVEMRGQNRSFLLLESQIPYPHS